MHEHQAARDLFDFRFWVRHQDVFKLRQEGVFEVFVGIFSLVLLRELLTQRLPVQDDRTALNAVQAMRKPCVHIQGQCRAFQGVQGSSQKTENKAR